jgi:hypothetical protein
MQISEELQAEIDDDLPAISPSLEVSMAATMRQLGDPPNTVEEAKGRDDWPQWKESLEKEMSHHINAGTWELVDPPKGVNIIGSKVVMLYKHGPDGKIIAHKSRFVAQGFSQEAGIDYNETFSPTAKLTAIRIIAAIAARNDWELEQTDVDAAYLNASLS